MAELFFGEYRFDTRSLALEGPGGPVEVRARTLQALTFLIEHRNRFVSRAELMQELWPDVHVTDASITQCISELRRALDDSARTPRYIETRVKYGYRFIATLYHKPTERLEPLPPPPGVEAPEAAPPPRVRRMGILAAAAAAALLVAVSIGLIRDGGPPDPATVSVSSVAAGGPHELTDPLASAIQEELVRVLTGTPGVRLVPDEETAGGDLAAEIATSGTPSGRVEVIAVVRSLPSGREVWGWTWIVPVDEDSSGDTARRIASRIVRAIEASRS